MKYFIYLVIVFIGIKGGALAQGLKTSSSVSTSSPRNADENLYKYVWSQTHQLSAKESKPIIDFNALDNWPEIGKDEDLSISPNGKYFAYSISKPNLRATEMFVVQSTSSSWRKEFKTAKSGFFTADSKQYIYQNNDDLFFVQLADSQIRCIKGIRSYKKAGNNSKCEWIAWLLKNDIGCIVLQNLLTGKEKSYDSVINYSFDETGQWLTCQFRNSEELLLLNLNSQKELRFPNVIGYSFHNMGAALVLKTTTSSGNTLKYVNLPTGDEKTIWLADKNTSVQDISFDSTGSQIVFIVKDAANLTATSWPHKSIWYYKIGMDKAEMKINNNTAGIDGTYFVDQASIIGKGYILVIMQKKRDNRVPQPDAVKLDVWNHKDTILQSKQLGQTNIPGIYSFFDPNNNRFIINYLELGKESAICKGDFAVIRKPADKDNGDRFWEIKSHPDSNWLIHLNDGKRELLRVKTNLFGNSWFSPGGKYLVYFDVLQGGNYFSYNLFTGQLVNISVKVPAQQLKKKFDYLRSDNVLRESAGIIGWVEGDAAILVYDNYDIWQLDLTGKKEPLNVTNNYGRSNHVILEFGGSLNRNNFNGLDNPVFQKNAKLLLKAFNMRNKYNGFFHITLGVERDPELLYMGPEIITGRVGGLDGMMPVKAADTGLWIIKRQSFKEAPNYFLTSDFKKYAALTDLQPQKKYNWLTAELRSFKQLDGSMSQGILYKPENFDSHKKYPVIISFYGEPTNHLYKYPTPKYLSAPIIVDEPAWFVSHGYLVFLPDIYFTGGQWGPSTINTVDGAARYLSKLPFVDGQHMGACGHSNSGRFGYYLLTHSHLFAAMALGSGTTNIISRALLLDKDGDGEESELYWAEIASYGTGLGNLWKNKKSWLDQTAVLNADRVTSPLLMYACKKNDVPVSDAIQMFISLWRLEKKVWWLQYDDGAHTLYLQRDRRDFTIRYTQFFDHYLKNGPAPRWMTGGIPANLKGIESRYEFAEEGSCGKDCKVCQAYKTGKLHR